MATRRRTWWSEPTDWATVCKRNRGRARYNSWRQYLATMRRRRVLEYLAAWGWKRGVQTMIARELGVHRSTISRDFRVLMPVVKECRTCHGLTPRAWWREA
jgi:hypothetical protein